MADINGNYYVCPCCANYYAYAETCDYGCHGKPNDLGGMVFVDIDNPVEGVDKSCDGCDQTVINTYRAEAVVPRSL